MRNREFFVCFCCCYLLFLFFFNICAINKILFSFFCVSLYCNRMLHSTVGVTPAGARVPEYVMPKNNYLSGDWKSHVWRGAAHYVPSERRWIAYHNYRCLPLLAKRDAKDLQSETEYVDFVRSRDTPTGQYLKTLC